MTEKDLAKNLKGLKKVKPNQDWVVFTKINICGQETKNSFISTLELFPRLILRYNKFAFAVLIIFGFLAGAFTFAQNSLPGDPAFVLKKFVEETKTAMAPQSDRPEIQLQLANQRLQDLNKIAQTNQSNKLAPAIQEFQSNVSQAAADLIKVDGNTNVKEVVSEAKKIKTEKEKVESLGVVVGGTEDLDSAFLQLLQNEIKDLQVRSLDASQQELFRQAVQDFNSGNYAEAFEEIYSINNPQE